jgi:hypothetical protein
MLLALAGAVCAGAVLFIRGPAFFLLAPVCGAIAGLGARSWRAATGVATGGVTLGLLATSFSAHPAWDVNLLGLPYIFGVIAAAALFAAGTAWLVPTKDWLPPVLSGVVLALTCAAMFASTFALDAMPDISSSYAGAHSATAMQQLAEEPVLSPQMSDEELFMIWVNRLRAGDNYYDMTVRLFSETYSYRRVMVRSPFSYRLPTLYVFLAALPRTAVALVVAMMTACSLGVAFTYLLARQFAGRATALMAAVVSAAVFTGYGNMTLLFAERWAGIAVLGSVAMFVIATREPTADLRFMTLSAALALFATSFRELTAPLLLLGILVTVATPAMRRGKAWIPWGVALALAAIMLASHWYLAAKAFASAVAPPPTTGWLGFWLHPDGSGLVGAVHFASTDAGTVPLVYWTLLALGMIGSLLVPLRLESRIMLAGISIGGPLALFLAHPPGVAGTGTAPGYWGVLVFPVVLASVTFAVARLAPAHSPAETSSEQEVSRRPDSFL